MVNLVIPRTSDFPDCRDREWGRADEGALCLSSWHVFLVSYLQNSGESSGNEGQAQGPHPSTSSTPCPYRRGATLRGISRFGCQIHQDGERLHSPIRSSKCIGMASVFYCSPILTAFNSRSTAPTPSTSSSVTSRVQGWPGNSSGVKSRRPQGMAGQVAHLWVEAITICCSGLPQG